MIELDIQNTSEVIRFLKEVEPKYISSAVRKGIGKVEKQMQKEVKNALKGTGIKNVNKAIKFNDSLIQGIRKTKIRQDSDFQYYGLVLANSNRKKGSGSYRLPIIENSSGEERYRKKYKNSPGRGRTGKFIARPFFSSGISKVDSGSIIQKTILDTIKKINAS